MHLLDVNAEIGLLAGAAVIDNTMDPPTVMLCVKQHLEDVRMPSFSHWTLTATGLILPAAIGYTLVTTDLYRGKIC